MKIVKIRYNKGMNTGYFIKHRLGYISVFFEEGIFSELKNIVDEKELELDLNGRVTIG